jgi:heme/copper-type cytochrome/quinol oxidase subunit 2
MFDNLPLWPERASAGAGNVDALYIFLVLLAGFMSAAIFTMIVVFALRYRRQPGREAEPIEGSNALEITWSVVPLGIFMVIFAWGAYIYFQERTPPRGATEVYVVAKQWMWKLEHPEGQRDSQLLRAGFSHQAGRAARALYHGVVPGHQAGCVSPVLCGVLRHSTFRHDWPDCSHGTCAI